MQIGNTKLWNFHDFPRITEMRLDPISLSSPVFFDSPNMCKVGFHLLWISVTSHQRGEECQLVPKKGGNEIMSSLLCWLAVTFSVSLFLLLKYLQLRSISVGNHAYENKGSKQSAMAICQHFYKQGNIYPGNDTFVIDPEIETGDILLYAITSILTAWFMAIVSDFISANIDQGHLLF